MTLGGTTTKPVRIRTNFSSHMASLQKKVQIRNGHRIHVKRLMAEMSGLTQGDVLNLKKIEKSLNEKATVLKNFDNDILELINEADVHTINRNSRLIKFI